MNNLLRGALAGIAATTPMTATMMYLHKHLPDEERFPLPPRNIAMKVAEDTGLRKNMNEKSKTGKNRIDRQTDRLIDR